MFKILEESKLFNHGVRVGFLKNGSPDPHLIVTFVPDICGAVDWPAQCDLRLQIGINEHQGFLRVSVSSHPTQVKYEPQPGGARADFGCVPALCREARPAKATEATVVINDSGSSVQFRLPTWERVESLPKFSAAKNATAPKPAKGGPKVIFSPWPVMIYGGKELPLYEFQAVLLEPLTRSIGGIFPPDVIIEKGYQALGRPPHPAVSYLLPTEMDKLRGRLKTLGLDLKHTKGMGYSIHVPEASE